MQTKHALPVVTILASTLVLSACNPKVSQTTNSLSTTSPTTPVSPGGSPTSVTVVPTTKNNLAVKEISVTTSYKNPSGEDSVKFTVMVDKTGVIVDAVTEPLAKSPISKMRQQSFAKDFPAVVKGKKLSELGPIDRVGGSSLTTGAFNASLEKLKAQLIVFRHEPIFL